MDEVRIGLFARTKTSVTLRVRHRAGDHVIVLLPFFQERLESLMVIRSEFSIHLKRCRVKSVYCVKTYTSLIAGTCLLGDQSQHFDFSEEIVSTLMDVSKAVDFLAREHALDFALET